SISANPNSMGVDFLNWDEIKQDTLIQVIPDTSTLIKADSLPTQADLAFGDTTQVARSSSSLQAPVNIISRDSSETDIVNNVIYLYREAKIKYQDFELTADYIKIDNR